MEQTATLKLNKPAKGTFDWDVPLNENWDKLDCLGAGQMPLLGQLIVDRKLTGAEATGWALQGSVLDGNVYKSVYSILSAARGRAVKENRTIKGATYVTYRDATTQLVFVDQSVYNNAFSALGDSIGYVINTSTKQITLPKRETFLRATVGKANYMDDESLPNIKGETLGCTASSWPAQTTGAFYATSTTRPEAMTGQSNTKPKLAFDASRSSSTYKNGALVRPRHTTVYIYYRVGNTIVNQEQIDVGNLTTQVNNINTNKANINIDNLSATGKANLVYWNLLNYAAPVTISGWTSGSSSGTPTKFTAPRAGVIVPYLYTHGASGTRAYIAGQEVANMEGGQSWTGTYPINKGEKLTGSGLFWKGTIKFFPYKGV